MFYLYRPQNSDSARELTAALSGQRVRNFENGRFFKRMRSGRLVNVPITARDHLVLWGAHVSGATPTQNVLNNAPIRSKFSDIEVLRRAGVPTVEASRTRPAAQAPRQVTVADPAYALFQQVRGLAEEFTNITFEGETVPRNTVLGTGVQDLVNAASLLRTAIGRPAPTPRLEPVQNPGEWVGRSNNHVGGADLLNPPAAPDYYVRKVQLTAEYRVHSFLGRSIRAGAKQLREGYVVPNTRASGPTPRGMSASPWIRTWDGGWRIVYDGVSASQAVRDLAHQAVAVLGLQFGAVDIGQTADGTLLVLEVNRAPGLEGGTITRYVDAIQKWSTGEWAMRTVEQAAATRAARPARASRESLTRERRQ